MHAYFDRFILTWSSRNAMTGLPAGWACLASRAEVLGVLASSPEGTGEGSY